MQDIVLHPLFIVGVFVPNEINVRFRSMHGFVWIHACFREFLVEDLAELRCESSRSSVMFCSIPAEVYLGLTNAVGVSVVAYLGDILITIWADTLVSAHTLTGHYSDIHRAHIMPEA